MEKERTSKVLISLVVGFFLFSSICIVISTVGFSQAIEDIQFTSSRQDTVDSVRIYSAQAFYGERGKRLPIRLRNRHVAEGLEFKVSTSSSDPISFSGHHSVPEAEPNDSCSIAHLVRPSELVNAYIEPPTDEDYYQFHVSVIETTVMILQAGRGASPGVHDMDTIRMWLYDPDCLTELAYAEDSLPAGVKIMYTFTDSGDHYYRVKIAGTGSDSGNYAFFVKDTMGYACSDTLAWYGENSVLTNWGTLRTHVFPESTSVHFMGMGSRETALDISSTWQYSFCYDFDVDPWIIVVTGIPPEIDTIYPDTFVVVSFSRAWVSDTIGVIHIAEAIPCTIWVKPDTSGQMFLRGDANNDTQYTMSDAIFILKFMYVPGSPDPGCMDAADVNDDGTHTMADAIYLLRYMYVPGSPNPPAPCCDYASDCGPDPTADGLDCTSHPCAGSKLK